jgi:hypothetical protein
MSTEVLPTALDLATQPPAASDAVAEAAHERRMQRFLRQQERRDQLRDAIRGLSARRMQVKGELAQVRGALVQHEEQTRTFRPSQYAGEVTQPFASPAWQYQRVASQRQAYLTEIEALVSRDTLLAKEYHALEDDLTQMNQLVERLRDHLHLDPARVVLAGA